MLRKTIMALALFDGAEANYRSGSVKTVERFKYGKFLARIRAPYKPGTCTSFFTFWDGPDRTVEGWNEIDVEIVPSVSAHPFSTNIISENHTMDQAYVKDFKQISEWHEYGIEWTPDYIAWLLDGEEQRRVEHTPDVDFLNKEQVLIMNFWTPQTGVWSEGFSPHDMPWYAKYDYVETYTWNGSGFDFHWRDDFDSFDESRWKKADGWGYDWAHCYWHAEQVYTQDGALHIKLEPSKTEVQFDQE